VALGSDGYPKRPTQPFDPPERAVPAALNGEALTVRAIPDAVVYAEFQD